MLLDVLRNERPAYAVVAFEGGKTLREEQYADYKAHRGPMPDDLRPQVARIHDLLDALCIPTEQVQGYEADDVVGSLAEIAKKRGDLRVVIVSGDSDFLQLVDDGVTVMLPGGQRFEDTRHFDTQAVYARYGFGPELVPDYKALVGDKSDNIPGVAGIGEKGAKALIAEFGGVEQILAHAEEITPNRARNAIAAGVNDARLSLELATINRHLDVPLHLEQAAVGDYDREALIDLFRELEFRSLLNRLPEPQTDRARTAPQEQPHAAVRTVVDTPALLDRLVARLEETGLAAVDAETDSLEPRHANLVGIAVAVSPDESYYVPVGHLTGSLAIDLVREKLAPALGRVRFYAHHAKYDQLVMDPGRVLPSASSSSRRCWPPTCSARRAPG
jgi:DNA polymerase-1